MINYAEFVKNTIRYENVLEITMGGIEYARCPSCPISSGKFISKNKHKTANGELFYSVAWIPSIFEYGATVSCFKVGDCKFRRKKPILYSQSLIGVDVLRNEYKSYGTKR